MSDNNNVFPDLYLCHCFEECGQCVCGVNERALRHYAYGAEPMPCMTPADVIAAWPDKELAAEALRAWVMYINSNV